MMATPPGSACPTPSCPSTDRSSSKEGSGVPGQVPDNLLRIKNHRRQAENSVQLLSNRIALLMAEEERSQRRIRAMSQTVEKVQRCQQEESELKQRLQQAKQVVSQTLIANATRVKQQSQKAKQKLAAKLRQELAEKRNAARDQRVRAAALKTSRGMASAHAESSADMIRKQKNEWMEKRRRSQEAAQRKAEKQREERLMDEVERRNQAEKKLMEMAALEQRVLENLMQTRTRQKAVYHQYEKLFKDKVRGAP
ncbi:Uncharacterized protein PBTT_05135 [Plasmodiophora brassicae]|uniref:Uncharacterized protein n=1 Tax=Plasmodiophora brassicae TaxID=37360 RepID=A0A0G4IX23_PLABS|nr:hypothetical protein PBRA_007382 [Plasmodiophora brassicae]SPQ98019.1 unnamed protein product [Plasmodiophora brassicae]